MPDSPIVLTSGHGALCFDAWYSLLGPHGARLVVDIRSEPYSRHAPDFSRSRLEGLCRVHGLGYRWLGDALGGRPSRAELQNLDGGPDWERIAASPAFAAAIDLVTGLARSGGAVLLCAEVDPDRCHRSHLVAPALEARGLTVIHVLGDGTTRRHQSGLFG